MELGSLRNTNRKHIPRADRYRPRICITTESARSRISVPITVGPLHLNGDAAIYSQSDVAWLADWRNAYNGRQTVASISGALRCSVVPTPHRNARRRMAPHPVWMNQNLNAYTEWLELKYPTGQYAVSPVRYFILSHPVHLSLIHIWRCRRSTLCRSRWSPYH